MIRKIVILLVRKKLGLKKFEKFTFDNQKTQAVYYFTETLVMKNVNGWIYPSSVSLNWLLNDDCKITKIS